MTATTSADDSDYFIVVCYWEFPADKPEFWKLETKERYTSRASELFEDEYIDIVVLGHFLTREQFERGELYIFLFDPLSGENPLQLC